MRINIILLFALLLSACNTTPPPTATQLPASAPTPDDLAPYRRDLVPSHKNDVNQLDHPSRYDLTLKYDPSTATLAGAETIRYTNRQSSPLSEIYVRLFANYPDYGGSIDISNLTVNGAVSQSTLEAQNTALKIPLAQPLVSGNSVQIKLDFSVKVPRGGGQHYDDFIVGDFVTTMPTVYPLIPAYDSRGWHIEVPPPYGDLVYADISLYTVTMTVPSNMTVIASGSTLDTKDNGDGTTTWSMVGAPMRDFDINVTTQLQKASQTIGDTTVNSWYEPQSTDSGKLALQFAVDSLKDYVSRFGDYPYSELDVVETPTTAGGIEYPGIVVIGRSLYNPRNRNFFEFATVHEVSHQWWYGVVGDDQVNYPWVDESLAQYSSYIYYDDIRGQTAAASVLSDYFQSVYNRAKSSGHDASVNQPVSAFNEDDYGSIVYGKGPLFYDSIRKKMGDDKFFQFLKDYYRNFMYKIAFPDDILNTAQSTCGCNLQNEYNEWILSPKQ